MNYISCKDYARHIGTTPRRVQQMCKDGKIEGAVKDKNTWKIPEEIKNTFEKLTLAIGEERYIEASSMHYYYVDKTLMLRDIIDGGYRVSLYTRPRRFGKTLNMDMIRTFFEISENDNSIYFKDKLIWKCGNIYRNHQGKYPVIFLSFKDIKYETWNETIDGLRSIISREFTRHKELKTSSMLEDYERDLYLKIASNTASHNEYGRALDTLSYFLSKHYKKNVIIIIDEYDIPIQQGHLYNFYNECIVFMRRFFSAGFKGNSNLAYGFLTGILRVAKESIFSGLNNLTVFSVIDNPFSQYFGFTEDEVDTMLKYFGCSDKKFEVDLWYDGYRFGNTKIYNPWSVLNYIKNQCSPMPYWQSTSNNDLLAEIIKKSTGEISEKLYKLLQGEEVLCSIDTAVVYPALINKPKYIFSFLLITGYLTINNDITDDNLLIKSLKIPNKEIAGTFENEILDYHCSDLIYTGIQDALLTCDINSLELELNKFLLQSISLYDGAYEGFYHGLMIGLCAILNNSYYIKSNREVGNGRFDLVLIPKRSNLPAFIFEFKNTNDPKADLKKLSLEGLNQINERKYDTDFKEIKTFTVKKIGIAFRGKEAVLSQ